MVAWAQKTSWKPAPFDYKGQLASFWGSKDQMGLNENGCWTWFQCYLVPSLYDWEDILLKYSPKDILTLEDQCSPQGCHTGQPWVLKVGRLLPSLHSKAFGDITLKELQALSVWSLDAKWMPDSPSFFTVEHMLNLNINFSKCSVHPRNKCQDN